MRVCVYDIEIEKAVLKRGEEVQEGIEYCKGFKDYEGCGVSVVGAMVLEVSDLSHGLMSGTLPVPRVFFRDNLEKFVELVKECDTLAGFNSARFDDRVLAANGIVVKTDIDLLALAWEAVGLDPDKFYWKTHGGFGLDALAKANGLSGKTGHGADAPVDWQRGNYGALVDYCMMDVWLTAMLLVKALSGQRLELPKEIEGWAYLHLPRSKVVPVSLLPNPF